LFQSRRPGPQSSRQPSTSLGTEGFRHRVLLRPDADRQPRRASGLAGGHRYNQRLLQDRSDNAEADRARSRCVDGGQFNRYFKSAA
jgi:hypothetical protein